MCVPVCVLTVAEPQARLSWFVLCMHAFIDIFTFRTSLPVFLLLSSRRVAHLSPPRSVPTHTNWLGELIYSYKHILYVLRRGLQEPPKLNRHSIFFNHHMSLRSFEILSQLVPKSLKQRKSLLESQRTYLSRREPTPSSEV